MVNGVSRRGPGEGYQVGLQQQDQLFAGEATHALQCARSRGLISVVAPVCIVRRYQSDRLVVLPFQCFSAADTRIQ